MLGVHRYRDTAKKIFPSIEKEERRTSIGDIVRRKVFSAFNKLKSAFVAFDLNNDGYISKDEFIIGIKSLLGTDFRIDNNDIDWLFNAFSDECEGYETQRIKYYQFCKLLVNLNNHEEYRLVQTLSQEGKNPYLVYPTSREQNSSLKRDTDMDFYNYNISKANAYRQSSGHIHTSSQVQNIDQGTQYIYSGTANDWIPYTPPAELTFPGEGSLHMSTRELNLPGNNAYEDVTNFYDDEKEFSDTTFHNTTLNSYEYGEYQKVIPGNEFEIHVSESMPYRELEMPDIMVRIATYVFETSKKLKEIFQSFDLNRDGYIGKDELVLGLESIGISISSEQAQDILFEYGSSRYSHTFASNGNGPSRIKYYQFVNFLTDSKMVLTDSASDRHTAEMKP